VGSFMFIRDSAKTIYRLPMLATGYAGRAK
jgi:hypothetical protein